jgi:2-oxoglutarate ferredoxin oxidoreductase subunit gamma
MKQNGRTEIRFAGYGGQGIALMGFLTGKAAVIHDRKQAVFTQSYGPEARGGASSADLVLSEHEIDYPLVAKPDVLVVMFQEAYHRFRPGLKPNGALLIDEALVKTDIEIGTCHRIPATRIAEELGKRIAANIVMLGAFAALTGLITREALEQTLRSTLKPAIVDLNLKALAKGWEHLQ